MEQDLFSEIVELHFYKITLLKLKVHATRPRFIADVDLEKLIFSFSVDIKIKIETGLPVL